LVGWGYINAKMFWLTVLFSLFLSSSRNAKRALSYTKKFVLGQHVVVFLMKGLLLLKQKVFCLSSKTVKINAK